MALGDITALQEQADGSFKEIIVSLEDLTRTTFSENPPPNPKQGDRWIDSLTLIPYDRLNGSWIETVKKQ